MIMTDRSKLNLVLGCSMISLGHITLLYFAWFLPSASGAFSGISNNTSPSFGCQPGWYRHGNSCFFFSYFWSWVYPSRDAWNLAIRECNNNDGDLVTVDNLEKLQFLTSIAHVLKLGKVFLGSRDTLKLSWKWFQGQPVNESLWGPGSMQGNQKCGSLFSKRDWCGWWWIDLPCDSWRLKYGYICEKPSASDNCSLGYLKIVNTCYKINPFAKKTWLDARSFCSQEGARLAVVDTEEKRVALSKTLDKLKLNRNTKVYIGLVRDMSDWSWIDGQPVNKSLFQAGRAIQRKITDQCLAFDSSKSVNSGLIAISCIFSFFTYYASYVCEKKEVNIAEGSQLTYSIGHVNYNNTQVQDAVDGNPKTCFHFITDNNTWVKVHLGKKTYVYKVKIIVSSSKNLSKSTFEVQIQTKLPYTLNETCSCLDVQGKDVFYECKPALESSAVIIRSSRSGSNLSICEIQVYGFASRAGSHGVSGKIWMNQPHFAAESLLEGFLTQFQNIPYITKVIKNLQVTYQLGDDPYLLLSSYLRVYENGDHYFLITCKKQCEMTIALAVEQTFQNDSSQSAPLLLHLTQKTSIIDWRSRYKQSPRPIKLSVCRLYLIKTYVKESYVTVGVKYPDESLGVPVPNRHLYWTKPGDRKFQFQMLPDAHVVEVGKNLVLRASYRYCCHGIECPNCSLYVQLHVFNSSLTIHPSLPMDCKEYFWSITKQAMVQSGNYSLEIIYYFSADKDLPKTRRTVGYIIVKETTLLRCGFTTKDVCGWERNRTITGHQWEKSMTGSFVATTKSMSTAFLKSVAIVWSDIFQAIGECLSFKYRLDSAEKKAGLEVYLSNKEGLMLLWRLNGFHGYAWNEALVSWRPQGESKLLFKGTGKVAISDVIVTTPMCSIKPLFANPGYRCPEEQFQCKNYQCIDKRLVCDGDKTCKDKSDEQDCVCLSTEFQCPSGRCLPKDKLCDNNDDCGEEADEKTCERRNKMLEFQCVDGSYVPWSVTCRGGSSCQDGSHFPEICSNFQCPLSNLACNESKTDSKEDEKCNDTFPVLCSLDEQGLGMCGLTSDVIDTLKWTKRSGPTPTQNTGPSFDHTTLSKKGFYLYIEASNVTEGTKARLHSKWFEANQQVCLQFWYHMFGTHIGQLNIIEMTNSTTSIKWNQTGDMGNRWLFGQVTLFADEPYKFVIEGAIGNGIYSDIAIDDIGIIDGACEEVTKHASPNCGFESDRCGWHGDKEWSLSNSKNIPGVKGSQTGGFLFLRKQQSYPFTHRISSPPLRLLDVWRCLTFSYYIGATESYFTYKLTLLLQSKNGTSIKLWGTPYATNKWIYVQVPFFAGEDGDQVTLKGELSHSAVIAVDEVLFSKTSCNPIPYHREECLVMTHDRADMKCCSFPFIYDKKIYYACDSSDPRDPQPWCSVTKEFMHSDNCDGYCPWNTIDGRCCMFPFRYNGKEYSSCITFNTTRPWCITDITGGWGFCQGECKSTEELCWWNSQRTRDATINWSVVSPSDVHREIINIANKMPRFEQPRQEDEQIEVHLPASQLGNITITSAVNDQIKAVTLCFWMTSKARGLQVLYSIPNSCKMIAGIGIHIDVNVIVSVLGHNWTAQFSVNDGAWHHVCVTWRSVGGTLKAYIDGRVSLREKPDELDSFVIKEDGTLTASIFDTASSKNDPDVKGKISGLNMWSREMNEFEVLAMSVGCGQEKGDLISWNSILTGIKSSNLKTGPAGCLFHGGTLFLASSHHTCPILPQDSGGKHSFPVDSAGQLDSSTGTVRSAIVTTGNPYYILHGDTADHFVFAANSTKASSVLRSPWYNRSAVGHTQCLRFRYIVYGPGAVRLRVMHRHDPNHFFVPVLDIDRNNQSGWRYAQTSVGSVNKYQLSIEAVFKQSNGFIAISVLYVLDGGCHKQPQLNQALAVTLTKMSGYVTSPFHPGYYEVDTTNIWVISAPKYHVIRLEIIAFDLEYHIQCTKDYLELFDGGSVKSSRIGRYCGDTYPPIIETTTNNLTIRFSSDSNNVRTGFMLKYTLKNVKAKIQKCALITKGCSFGATCYVISSNDPDKSQFVMESAGQSLENLPVIPRQTSILLFGGNKITKLTKWNFGSPSSLEYIDLSGNLIFSTKSLEFTNMPLIKVIRLNGNFISSFPKFGFLPKLHTLDLGANRLSNVTKTSLKNLPGLRILSLRVNQIAELEDEMFAELSALQYLYLDNNNIKKITENTFKGLKSLKILHLQNNKLSEKDVPRNVFGNLKRLKQLKLDNFILCCYAETSISESLHCESQKNEFSSCEDMMKSSAVRFCLWILGIMASLGNILVIAWRLKVRDENKVQSLLLTNLAIADFLMGIYLLILAVKDIQFKGEYYKHDVEWRAGTTCQLAGALSMLSSEASVLTLTVITADRLISVVFAFKFPRLSLKVSAILCSFIWTFCLIISFLPIVGLDYFEEDDQHGFGFYSRSTVCLPLRLSSQHTLGWEYSITFFIFLNLAAFLFILFSYCAIFWTIVRMSRSSATKHMRKESSKAARLFFIIFTDFCCWMPVIILALLSFTYNFNDSKGNVYVWIAVFVLPLNSSVNPVLYTFSTEYVKRHVSSMSIFSSLSYQSYSKNRSRTGDDISLKEKNESEGLRNPKVIVSFHDKDLAEELKIIEELNLFRVNNLGETVGFVLAETKSRERVLLKYFGEKNLEDWKREVMVQNVLKECSSHDNVMMCKWNADSEGSLFSQLDPNISSMPSNAWLICYTFSSSKTLKDFCETHGGPDVLYNVVLDIISGLEFLHSNRICHHFINDQSILIEDKTGIPRFKAVIGDFRHSFLLPNNPECDSCKHKSEDVKQLGVLFESLLKMCDEQPANEVRSLTTISVNDKSSEEILLSWRQTLLQWDFSSSS